MPTPEENMDKNAIATPVAPAAVAEPAAPTEHVDASIPRTLVTLATVYAIDAQKIAAGDMTAKAEFAQITKALQASISKMQTVSKTKEAMHSSTVNSAMIPINRAAGVKTAANQIITPEDASRIDGVKVKEITASDKGNEMDILGLYNGRATDRTNDPNDGKRILPGNLHDEMISHFGTSTGKLVEATLSDTESKELEGLSHSEN